MRFYARAALLSVLLFLSGLWKIPSFIPGTEFQLSAPLSLFICMSLGFSRYLLVGVVASLLTFFTGTGTLLHIAVALIFRITAGIGITYFGPSRLSLALSGACGTLLARLILSFFLGVSPLVMMSAAIPGILFTALTVWIFYTPLCRLFSTLSLQENPSYPPYSSKRSV